MGNHSMKNKKPGTVLSIGPVFLSNLYQKTKINGKRVRILVKQYEGNPGANRHERRAMWPAFRKKYGRSATAIVRKKMADGVDMASAIKTFLDESLRGKVYGRAD